MRNFLFVAYCFGNDRGHTMIGVYKRALRVGLELVERGNNVVFYCSGRRHFHDPEIARAEEQMTFVDIPYGHPAYEGVESNRANFLKHIVDVKPDVVVIGEAPLAGPLLEATLCTVELEIPVVCLDNAYQPLFVRVFCHNHGGIFDGIILTGPSSLHLKDAPDYLVQVSPYVKPSAEQARKLLIEKLGLRDSKLIVVLAYDHNVEALGLSALEALNEPDVNAVFIVSDVGRAEGCLRALPSSIRKSTRAILPQPDPILFGLLELAQAAIVKLGFMQVTESLSLHTPVVGLYYPGCFSIGFLPKIYHSYIHATTKTTADPDTVIALREFLQLDSDALTVIHNGAFDAVEQAADYLEALPLVRRQGVCQHTAQLGFTKERIYEAVAVLEKNRHVEIHECRSSSLRGMPSQKVLALTCAYSVGGARRFARLWGRLFRSPAATDAELKCAAVAGSRREILYASSADRVVIEKDLGEALLPTTKECAQMGIPYVGELTDELTSLINAYEGPKLEGVHHGSR